MLLRDLLILMACQPVQDYSMYIYIYIFCFLNAFCTVIWYQVFLSNTNNLCTVVWFQVFPSNTNHHHHVVPLARISLTLSPTSPHRSSPLAGLQGYIPYPHIAAVCMFELVILLLPGHMWGSIGIHHLWARPCFSSSVLHVWFI